MYLEDISDLNILIEDLEDRARKISRMLNQHTERALHANDGNLFNHVLAVHQKGVLTCERIMEMKEEQAKLQQCKEFKPAPQQTALRFDCDPPEQAALF